MPGIELNSSSLDTTNLEGYWRLESDGTDTSTNGNDLTNNNTTTFVSGKFGNAADFERSSSQSLTITDASQSGLDLSGDHTISAWVKLESVPGTNEIYTIVSKYDSGADERSYLFHYRDVGGTKSIRMQISSDGTSGNLSGVEWFEELKVGGWYHLLLTCDISEPNATKYNLWLNGKNLGNGTIHTDNAVASIYNSSTAFSIGSFYSSGTQGNFFDGIIDDVAVWSVVITDDEAEQLYFDSPQNGNWTGSKRYYIPSDKVSGSADHVNFPVLIKDSVITSTIFAAMHDGEVAGCGLSEDGDLSAYYRMETSAITTDSSGRGNTLTNNNTVGETASGKFGYAADFGSSNSTKYLSTTAELLTHQAFTVSMWLKRSADISTGTEEICDIRMDTASESLRMNTQYEYNSGSRRILVGLNDISHGNNYYFSATLGTGWNHIAYVFDDANNEMRVYLNGGLVLKQAWTAAGTTGWTDTLELGRYWSGYMDDVSIYNRALDYKEVLSMYIGGADLRITTDEDGTTEVPVDKVFIDTSAEEAQIWFKMPTLQYSANSPFYLWYGNSDASPLRSDSTYGSENVYSAYDGVWHKEEAGAYRRDETTNDNVLSDNNTVLSGTGKVDTGADFELSNSEYLSIADASQTNLDQSSDFQISCWIKLESLPASGGTRFLIVDKFNPSPFQGYLFRYRNTSGVYSFQANIADGTSQTAGDVNYTLSVDTWYYLTIQVDASEANVEYFLNGVSIGTFNGSGISSIGDSTTPFVVGGDTVQSAYFDGIIDELRVIGALLSSDWLLTEYTMMNDPTTFILSTITQECSESVTVVDTLTKSMKRSLSDSTTLVDLLSKKPGKTLSESVSIVDSILRSICKCMTETVTPVDSITRSISRIFTDTTTPVDVVNKKASKIFTESFSIIDILFFSRKRGTPSYSDENPNSASYTTETPNSATYTQERGRGD